MPLKAFMAMDGNFKVGVFCATCGERIWTRGNIVWNGDISDLEFTHKSSYNANCDDTNRWPQSHDLTIPLGLFLMEGNER